MLGITNVDRNDGVFEWDHDTYLGYNEGLHGRQQEDKNRIEQKVKKI